MKKSVLVLTLVLVAIAALGTTAVVFAQGPSPDSGYGPGMMFGRGQRGPGDGTGLLHDAMIGFIADKLGLTVDELNTRLAGGETMLEIAEAEGLTVEEFWTVKTDARSAAIDQAVADGTLTAEQAEWMKSRGSRMGGGWSGGGRGSMMRGFGASSGCPHFGTVTQ